MSRNALDSFISDFLTLPYPGLLVVDEDDGVSAAARHLRRYGMYQALSWQQVLSHLQAEHEVFVVLRAPLDREFRDLLTQYEPRAGAIDVVDHRTLRAHHARFCAEKAHLLLVASSRVLRVIELIFPLSDKVGLIERVVYGKHVSFGKHGCPAARAA